jgi:hypothetical protein
VLDPDLAAEVLRAARTRGWSFAELFVEERRSVAIRLDDGKVEELTSGLDRGAGVRVARGTSYGYAFSNRLDRDALLEAAEAAAAALQGQGQLTRDRVPDPERAVPADGEQAATVGAERHRGDRSLVAAQDNRAGGRVLGPGVPQPGNSLPPVAGQDVVAVGAERHRPL